MEFGIGILDVPLINALLRFLVNEDVLSLRVVLRIRRPRQQQAADEALCFKVPEYMYYRFQKTMTAVFFVKRYTKNGQTK